MELGQQLGGQVCRWNTISTDACGDDRKASGQRIAACYVHRAGAKLDPADDLLQVTPQPI